MRVRGLARGATHFTAFYLLSSLAEGVQSVVLLWLTYALTKNALLVGTTVVLGYLPGTVAGLIFRRRADRGHAERIARYTNLWLALVSSGVAVDMVVGGSVAVTISVMMASRVVLGLVKMVNTAAIGRLVRGSFDEAASARVLQLSSSSSLTGLIIGTAIGGVMASAGLSGPSLLVAAAAYAGSAVTMAYGTRGYRPLAPRPEAQSAPRRALRPAAGKPTGTRVVPRVRWDLRIVVVLLFSVPSSGAVQYISTLLVPLSQTVSPGHPAYYAALDIAACCGGFLAGILLSTALVSSRGVLNLGLPAAAVLAVALGVTHNRAVVLALAFAIALVITGHVVCMQVLTNQVPAAHEVGEFTVLRTVVASLAKVAFAFAAGAAAGALGPRAATIALAACLLPFAAAWFALGPRSHVLAGSSQ